MKAWLVHNQDEWEELKIKWKRSSPWRLLEVGKLQDRTCASILREYPTLRNHRGYQLVQIDFAQKFPGKDEILFERWIDFANAIKPILQVEVSDVKGKSLLACLDAADITEGKFFFISILFLFYVG